MTLTLIASLAMTFFSIALASPIARIFVGYDETLCAMTVNALRLYSLSFLVCGFNIFGSAFFTGLNNGTASALISFLRTLVIQVAAILILPKILGINGIWLAITVAEALTDHHRGTFPHRAEEVPLRLNSINSQQTAAAVPRRGRSCAFRQAVVR